MSTAETAGDYVRRMVEWETRGFGDTLTALERIAWRYSLPYWSMNHLRIGRAKTVDAGLLARIRTAYIALCERQIAELCHVIETDKAVHGDDFHQDIEAEIAALATKLAAKKAGLR